MKVTSYKCDMCGKESKVSFTCQVSIERIATVNHPVYFRLLWDRDRCETCIKPHLYEALDEIRRYVDKYYLREKEKKQ